MNIGILTYNSVFNFGANLQAISTANYLRNNGYTPIFINWVPEELENKYATSVSEEQKQAHIEAKKNYMTESSLCRTDDDVLKVIKQNTIEGIIIGSDAVLQHFEIPLKVKLKSILKPSHLYSRYTRDRLFPNPYWGSFFQKLEKKIPVVIMSGSSQNANYMSFKPETMKRMTNNLLFFSYISVRDTWTSNMLAHITEKKIIPEVTPDPVFGFNFNVPEIKENAKKILEKFNLPEKYLLVSFKKRIEGIDDTWMQAFEQKAKDRGYAVFALPLPEKLISYGLTKSIALPVSPLEWYSLIINSSGYIGQNMHPIVVSLHNANPFFSFDYYGLDKVNDEDDSSSKISHILKVAGLSDYRVSSVGQKVKISPDFVLDKIQNFETKKSEEFRNLYLSRYKNMMEKIISKFK
jgi:hypothetical protein